MLTHLVTHTVCKLLLAAFLGGIIGLERELRGKPAGLRTNMLIAMGSALFTTISMQMAANADPTRIAAQVVTGIGFIGAGVILREHGAVIGLTTAATIFVVAAIGVAVGAGLWWPSVVATAIVLVTLLALVPIERWLKTKRTGASIASAGHFSSDGQATNALSSIEAANLAAELSSMLVRYQLRVEPIEPEESHTQRKNSP
ncbi:MgtC/SapB family protein [candidate division KSB1 bacterium]|nr:MgtC/SapB family protein [candidate division KSB1 bacterium]